MFPRLIDLGTYDLPFLGETPIFLPTYGALFAGAVVLAWWWFSRRARSLGVDDEVLFNLSFYTLLAGIVGAKLLFILVEWRTYLLHPGEILGTIRSAGVLAGGVIGGAIAFIYYSRRNGLPTWKLADAIAAPLVMAQGVGRLGCFAAGCCWGVPVDADHPFAVTFTDPHTQTGVPMHEPLLGVQLIQAGSDLLLAGLLTLFWRRRIEPPGTVFWLYVLLYSVARGLIELWRGDVARGLHLGGSVSTSQLLAIGGALLAIVMLLRGRSGRRQAVSA